MHSNINVSDVEESPFPFLDSSQWYYCIMSAHIGGLHELDHNKLDSAVKELTAQKIVARKLVNSIK